MIDDADPKLRRAVNEARSRVEAGQKDPEPPLARRFGQIGVLGWVIVGPTLAGLGLGHWIDGALNSGITVSAAGCSMLPIITSRRGKSSGAGVTGILAWPGIVT